MTLEPISGQGGQQGYTLNQQRPTVGPRVLRKQKMTSSRLSVLAQIVPTFSEDFCE